jgi:hypothetical protein
MEELLHGIGDGGDFNVTIGIDHRCRVSLIVGGCLGGIGVNDKVCGED